MTAVLSFGIFVGGFNASVQAGELNPFPSEIYAISSPMGAVALQPDGKILVANGCYVYSVDTASGVLALKGSGAFRFNPDGTMDRGFQCNIEPVNFSAPMSTHIGVSTNGHILLTGSFNAVDGKPRPGYAMLLPDGKLDESFEPWRGFTNPPARTRGGAGSIKSVALLSNDWVAVGSSEMGDRPYPTVYCLDATGCYLPAALPRSENSKYPRGLMAGTLTAMGFWAQREIDWETNIIHQWNYWPPKNMPHGLLFPLWGSAPSAADAADGLRAIFEEVPLEMCRYAVRLSDGGVILAVRSQNCGHLMRFDKNWRPDLSFTNSFQMPMNGYLSLAVQPDGKLLFAGGISQLNGEPFTGVARLERTGETDHSFHCQTVGGPDSAGKADVMSLALQGDGKIIIVGFFSEVNGIKCPHMARLNPDGSLDMVFQSHFTTHEGLNAWRRVPVQQLQNLAASHQTIGPATITGTSANQTVLINSINIAEGVAVVQFQGNPNQTYFLQAAETLSLPSWVNIATNRTDSAGSGILRDEQAKEHTTRFYRVATP